ncbi:hypothetical protein BJV85_002092 [Clostridium acetobutylicum]|nr:hypothetical protein [Clostridium acetobutylicum]
MNKRSWIKKLNIINENNRYGRQRGERNVHP